MFWMVMQAILKRSSNERKVAQKSHGICVSDHPPPRPSPPHQALSAGATAFSAAEAAIETADETKTDARGCKRWRILRQQNSMTVSAVKEAPVVVATHGQQ
jgi:hypothetical protein